MSSRRLPSLPPKITGFEYVGLLGMGGFADVFEYRQDFPRRSVAVKVLLDSSLDPGSRDSFFAEANIMAGLSQHPSIVTIHQAAISADGRPYFIMEYCSRPSLGARFRTERISVAEALRTGIRVASAVETAHRLGVLHRDIKPANILATDFGWPALTDFGIAGSVGDTLVASGMSIPWAPPELLSDEPYGDARSDVYSLAATLYSLLAGRSPFEIPGQSNSPIDLITRIERDNLRSVDRVDVPQSLNLVLARAMAKDPSQRFPSAVAFAHALQSIEREMQLPVTGIDVTDATNVRPQPPQQPEQPDHAPDEEQSQTRLRGQGQPGESSSIGGAHSAQPAPAQDTDDEATRMRGVTSVAPEAPTEPELENPGDVATRLRPVTTIRSDEAPEAAPERTPQWSPVAAQDPLDNAFEPKQFEDTADSRGYFYARKKQDAEQKSGSTKRLTILISLASVLLLMLVLLFIGNKALSQNRNDPESTPSATSTSTLDTGSVPPVSNLEVQNEDAGRVQFVWNNPDPQEGDAYLWRIVDLDNHAQTKRITETSVTVDRETENAQVCIEVSVVRANGKMSNTPTRECS